MCIRLPVVCLWTVVISLVILTDGSLGGGNEAKFDKSEPNIVVSSITLPKVIGNSNAKLESLNLECEVSDKECEKDKLDFEAIRNLHLMIDDDHNGNVDLSESDEFLRDELQYTDGFDRQELFHHNDKLISVDDLWKAWKHSAVYNWTVNDVIEWLVEDVDLPQYSQTFHNFAIDGSVLPRLVNSTSPLLASLGIRNPVHKQKLSLKAMDTVLFGAPKRLHNYAKDVILFMAVLLAIGIGWFACLHHRYSQTQVKKMMKDLEALQKAEDALKKLSNELADAEKTQVALPAEKQEELRMLRQNSLRLKVPRVGVGDKSPTRLNRDSSSNRMKLQQAEQELANLREALTEAENRLEIQQQLENQWTVPGELQAWLQLTYELEQVHFNAKRQAAERQLLAARDGCEKIKKRKQAFFGPLRMAHSNSLDEIDQSILDARAALEEVKQDLQERLHRWHTIEILCGFPILNNPGLLALRQAMGRDTGNGVRLQNSLMAGLPFEETDEDSAPAGFTSAATLASASKSSTFLKQQASAGAAGPLAHTHKAPSSGLAALTSVKNGSREVEPAQGTAVGGPPTAAAVGPGNSVIFQLGDRARHQRSHSIASLSLVNANITNSSHYGHAQGPNAVAQGHHGALSTQATPSRLRISSSSGNLITHNAINRTGSLTLKMLSSASGNPLSARTVPPQSSAASASAVKFSLDSPEDKPQQNGTGHVEVNNSASVDSGDVSTSKQSVTLEAVADSSGMPTNILVKTNQQEDSESTSSGSIANGHSGVVLSRGRHEHTPEQDQSSPDTDSPPDFKEGEAEVLSARRNGKKKTLLPKFLQKNKGKQKTA
ncbi:hypothetical protein BsWGS_27171 [Bradybaena similaris]